MSRSLSYLRRGLLGIAFVGSLGFGVTQALASPPAPSWPSNCSASEIEACETHCAQTYAFGQCKKSLSGDVTCICHYM